MRRRPLEIELDVMLADERAQPRLQARVFASSGTPRIRCCEPERRTAVAPDEHASRP